MIAPDKNTMLDSDINSKRKMIQELYAIQHNEKKKSEQLVNLGGFAPDDKLIASGIAIAGYGVDAKTQSQVFATNKNVDRQNERRPPGM